MKRWRRAGPQSANVDARGFRPVTSGEWRSQRDHDPEFQFDLRELLPRTQHRAQPIDVAVGDRIDTASGTGA